MHGKSHKDQARFLSILAEDVGVQAYELSVNYGYSKAERQSIVNDYSQGDLKPREETPCTLGFRSNRRAKHSRK